MNRPAASRMPRPRSRLGSRPDRRKGKDGQIIVLFALCLVAIIAMAGLLIDGGMAWSNRRQAQAAADTAALAAAQAASGGTMTDAETKARAIAAVNGFGAGKDCAGNALPDSLDGVTKDGVTVNRPPLSGQHIGDTGFVEVVTTRAMHTAFAGAIGMPCWMVSARAVASIKSQVATCSFCSLSNYGGEDRYAIDLNAGNDLRVDGDIFSNHATWYSGAAALGGSPPRCSTSPCSPANCVDWVGSPTDRIRMCGHSIYIDNDSGCCSILSARTISMAGGWESNAHDDVLHADQLALDCPAHPKNLGYISLGVNPETNVCIGAAQRVDPLNDPNNPADIMPKPDLAALSTCSPGLCGPVVSATCKAEPGTTLMRPSFTYPSDANILSIATGGNYTICPGIYYGGFSVSESQQPHVIMLPGTYVMIGGGFTVKGTASITSVSSQGDGVTIYNTGGSEALTESFPGDDSLYTSLPCPNAQFPTSSCLATGTPVLNPPSTAAVVAGNPITYKLTVPKGTFAGAPTPTGTAASFTFYNGPTPIACEGPGIVVTTVGTSLVATCTTRYTTFGNKGITAVYAGNAVYKPTGAVKIQRVDPPTGTGVDNVHLGTSCTTQPLPCGQILLHAPTSGRYSGLLIFQDQAPDRNAVPSVYIEPYAGAPACDETPVSTPLGTQPAFMAYGVPPDTHPVPAPCGPLGGLSGTIYSVHLSRTRATFLQASTSGSAG